MNTNVVHEILDWLPTLLASAGVIWILLYILWSRKA